MFMLKLIRELEKRLQASSFDWAHLGPPAGHEFSHCTPQSSSSPRDTWPKKHQSHKYQDVWNSEKTSRFFFFLADITTFQTLRLVHFYFKDRTAVSLPVHFSWRPIWKTAHHRSVGSHPPLLQSPSSLNRNDPSQIKQVLVSCQHTTQHALPDVSATYVYDFPEPVWP